MHVDNQNNACLDSLNAEYENEVSLFPLNNFMQCMNVTSLKMIMQGLLNTMISSHVNMKDAEDKSGGSENKEGKVVKKKPGRKPIIGGLSRGTF